MKEQKTYCVNLVPFVACRSVVTVGSVIEFLGRLPLCCVLVPSFPHSVPSIR